MKSTSGEIRARLRSRLLLSAAAVMFPAAAFAQNVTLDPVDVNTQRARQVQQGQPATAPEPAPKQPARTEGKDTYTNPVVTVGSKEALPLNQIPMSVTTVTRQRMDDQNLTQLDEAMRNTTGMVVLQNDAGRSSIFSRGYEVSDALVDGLPAPMSSILGTQPDLFIFDRVEVLKGPMALYFGGTADGGNAGPGATVNLARKRATDRWQGILNQSVGSWSNYRTEVDIGGPLNASKTVRGRLVGAFQNRDSFVDINDNQVWIGYGTVEFDFTPNTTLSLAAWRQERDITPFNGLPAYAGPPARLGNFDRSTFVGAAWNRFENYSNEYLAELEHRFIDGGHAKVAARYVDRFIDYKYTNSNAPLLANGTFANMSLVAANVWERAFSTDAHVSKPFEAFGQTHNLTIGTNYRRQELTNFSPPATTTGGGPYNIFTYDPSTVPEPNPAYTVRTMQEPEQTGVYANVRIKPVQPLTVILGGRYSWYNYTNINLATNTVTNDIHKEKLSPYAGVIVDLTKNISFYVSYSDIFLPQTQLTASGQIIQPREGKQYEGGFKGTYLDGRLNTSISYFQILDTNRAIADGLGTFVAAGETKTEGFELEASGSPLPGLEIYAGYTNSTTHFLTGGVGDFRTFWPRHTANFWGKYTPQQYGWRNWHIAGGAKYMSSFYSGTGASRLYEDGYIVVDGQIGYKFSEHLSAALTVTNLLDEKYYTRLGSTSLFNFYGEPRAYNFKLSSKW